MSDNAVVTTEKDDLATETHHDDTLTASSEDEEYKFTFMNLFSIVVSGVCLPRLGTALTRTLYMSSPFNLASYLMSWP